MIPAFVNMEALRAKIAIVTALNTITDQFADSHPPGTRIGEAFQCVHSKVLAVRTCELLSNVFAKPTEPNVEMSSAR